MSQSPDAASSASDREAAGGAGHSVSRRRFLIGSAGAAAAGAVVGAGATRLADPGAPAESGTSSGASTPVGVSGGTGSSSPDLVDLATRVPFYDQPHPPGIITAPQRHAAYMSFDMLPGTTARDLQVLLARWTAAIAQLTAGKPIGQVQPTRADAVGLDTGEALGLEPASLTITVGLGPSLFDKRFGLAGKRPILLRPLPAMPSGGALQAAVSDGDLSIQACADDPQVTYHAVRNLARMVRDTAQTRWTVMGFGRASAGAGQQTPRNLLGFKDGTRNIVTDADRAKFVWIDDGSWMSGGSYQVVRKIEMHIEVWDADRVSDQENVFGRTKSEGAPLGGEKEFETPDFTRKTADGAPVIDPTAHIALAAHENNNGVKILRRSYNYTDGIGQYGQLDAGLLFIAYLNDPAHFVTLQSLLGARDLLNEYITHIGSGLFAVPPTPATGHYIGEALFS